MAKITKVIRAEEDFRDYGCVGATHREVRLEVAGGVATIGDRKIRIGGDVVAIWHYDECGTWHGFIDPASAKVDKAGGACPAKPVGEVIVTGSGAGDCVAAVVKVPAEGLIFLTSGYRGRRDWKYHILSVVSGEVVEDVVAPADYRARFAVVESL